MRRLNVVWMVIAPRRAHAFGLDVVGNDFLAVSEGLVTDPAVPFLSGDLLGEEFPQFRGRTQFPVSSGMIWVFDSLDACGWPAGLECFRAAATDAGVMNGTTLVSVKFHGNALVCIRGCCALLCQWGVLLCSASVKGLKCGGQDAAAELKRMRLFRCRV
jgi:hypothetical protein